MGTPESQVAPPMDTFAERAVWAVLCFLWKLIRFPAVALLIIL